MGHPISKALDRKLICLMWGWGLWSSNLLLTQAVLQFYNTLWICTKAPKWSYCLANERRLQQINIDNRVCYVSVASCISVAYLNLAPSSSKLKTQNLKILAFGQYPIFEWPCVQSTVRYGGVASHISVAYSNLAPSPRQLSVFCNGWPLKMINFCSLLCDRKVQRFREIDLKGRSIFWKIYNSNTFMRNRLKACPSGPTSQTVSVKIWLSPKIVVKKHAVL